MTDRGHAVACFRAIDLANGLGSVYDIDDTELRDGVWRLDLNESRRPPIVWTSRGHVINLLSDTD
eukprot:764616-Heterocapsa_arctica.AAC.1